MNPIVVDRKFQKLRFYVVLSLAVILVNIDNAHVIFNSQLKNHPF